MTSNNYNYGGNYPPVNNRAPAPQQSFATSSATAGDPYYSAQSSATPTRTYPNNDYQYQQYPQQASANNSGGYNWGVYSGGKATPAIGMESLGNPSVLEQTPSTTTKSNAHNSYDTSNLGNLAYASGLNYNSAAETVQSTTRYSGGSVYEGSARGSAVTPSQVQDRARPDSTNSRASPVTGTHPPRHAPGPNSGMKSGTAYNLPTPSPAYPQSLINSYPQRSANTTMSSGGAPATSRAPDAMEASSRNMQQSQYAPFTPSQPQKPATARAFKQEQNRQTSNPPAAPIARSTVSAVSNAYINQPRSQAARGPNSQSGRAVQNSPPPAATLPPAKMPTNVIRRTGDGQIPTTQNINSQPNQCQHVPTSQLPPTSNYLPRPTQSSTARNQPPPQPQRRPSPDQPTTVDPSHVYNSYHEYQKQIEAAEAEAARFAKSKDMAAMEEQRRHEALIAQQQKERADMTRPAVQAAMTLANTMSGNNAPESESESEEDEDEQGEASNDVDDDNDDQHITTAPNSENNSHSVSAALANSKGKAPAPRIPVHMLGAQGPPKDETTVTMEEEMRRMVEKLRDYQSKDPKLFLQVWSSVRKTGTGQSPQPQAEGSQTQGSPVTQPAEASQQSPTPNTSRPAASVPNAPTIVTASVSASAPPPASKRKKSTLQSPGSSKSPSTQAKTGPQEDINAKRRAKRPSRSKAALAARAAAERAEAEAAAATTTVPASQEPALVTPAKPRAIESQGNSKSTTGTPGVTPVSQLPQTASSSIAKPTAANNAAANVKPINNTQQTPAAPSQVTGRAQHASPAAHPPPPPSPPQDSAWPTDKREAIAKTAASVLNEIPENDGKRILSWQIRDMLEGNPSYLELCEMIEGLGFKMDRARFAKTLLAALPGNPKPRSQPRRPAAQTPTSGKTPSVPPAPQAQESQQNTPRPLPPAAAIAARNPEGVSPLTPAAAQAPPQASQTPDSETPKDGKVQRRGGRPRKDGKPQGSPYTRYGARSTGDRQPVESSYARGAAERLENYVPPKPIVPGPLGATATATTAPANTSVSVTTSSTNAATKPPQSVPVATAATNAPGVHPHPHPPPNALGPQPQSHPPPVPAATAPPNAPGQLQGPGRSAPLSAQEMHHMSLLRAYVGKHGKASRPALPQEGAAGTYSSPYQNNVAPPQSAPSGAAPPETSWKTWRQTATTQTYPYSPRQNIPNPTAAGASPNILIHHNPPFSRPAAPSQHGQSPSVPHPAHPCQARPPAPNQYQTPAQSAVPQRLKAPVIPAAPLTKEAQARKRTFAEIIDLTKGESLDKGEEHSEKRQRIAAGGRINILSDELGPKTGELPTRPTQPKPLPFQHHHQPYANANTQSHNNITNITVNPQVEVTRNPLLEYDGIVKSIDRSLALRKSRYDPKTIARDILISAGKHPTQRSLNGHLEQLKERFTKVDNTSDLSTFRWDIVDPGGAAVGSANMPPTGQYKHVGYPLPLTETSHIPSRPSGLRNETLQANFAIVIPDDNDEEDGENGGDPIALLPKRRGRPPRDPNAVKPTPAKRVLTRSRGTPNGAVSTRHADDDEADIPPPKRRTRGPNKSAERPLSRLGQPHYLPFLCEWHGCKAELQNLETLRRHVYVVHGKAVAPGEFGAKACLWGKCGKEGKSRNGDGEGEGDVEMGGVKQTEMYGDEEAFKGHVEKAHIVPLSWHMGDGPRGSTIGEFEFIPSFLLPFLYLLFLCPPTRPTPTRTLT